MHHVLILHHVGELLRHIGLFNYPKITDETLPWETTNEVVEFQQDYDCLIFTTRATVSEEPSESMYSVKRVEGSFWWKGTFKNKTAGIETEGECTCFIFD